MKIRMRNDFVLVKVVDTGKIGSVLTTQKSSEGKEYFIEKVGDKVQGLAQGDRVFLLAGPGSGMFIPNSTEFFFTKEENVVLVYDKEQH